MRRLTGIDSVYLYQETPTAHMHTLKISILKPAESVPNLEQIKQHFAATMHRFPALRWRIVPVPFGLHHPVAVEDPDFDIDFHFRHVALPRPATMRELDNMIAQIAGQPLNRDRPLWELWVVEGLHDDRLALVLKAHHAIADGTASVHLFTQLLADPVDGEEVPGWHPPPIPTPWQLVRDALVDHIKHDARGFPGYVRMLVKQTKAVRLHRKELETPAVDPLLDRVVPCRLNGALSTQRKFATTGLSLSAVRDLKEVLEGTVNDVVLALVAGALRSYLLNHGDSLAAPLIASIPVSADEPGTVRMSGNNLTMMTSRLHVEIADPILRFDKIRESANVAKADLKVYGRSTLPTMLYYTPPGLLRWSRLRAYRLKSADRPDFRVPGNVAVSNVPGPRERLVRGGAELESLYSVGPLMEGTGLNITVWSYMDQLNFSIISCKKLVPDPQRIATAIDAALVELQSLARKPSEPTLEGSRS
jgi:WS/DGAT/MGAT family acyltransferase